MNLTKYKFTTLIGIVADAFVLLILLAAAIASATGAKVSWVDVVGITGTLTVISILFYVPAVLRIRRELKKLGTAASELAAVIEPANRFPQGIELFKDLLRFLGLPHALVHNEHVQTLTVKCLEAEFSIPWSSCGLTDHNKTLLLKILASGKVADLTRKMLNCVLDESGPTEIVFCFSTRHDGQDVRMTFAQWLSKQGIDPTNWDCNPIFSVEPYHGPTWFPCTVCRLESTVEIRCDGSAQCHSCSDRTHIFAGVRRAIGLLN